MFKSFCPLQQEAFIALLAPPGLQCRPGGHFENLPDAILGFSRTFHVSEGTDSVGHISALLRFDRLLRGDNSKRTCSMSTHSTSYPGTSVAFHTCFILKSSRRVCSSFRRSFLLPTRIMGTLGQKCFTSGVHFSGMFSAKNIHRSVGR